MIVNNSYRFDRAKVAPSPLLEPPHKTINPRRGTFFCTTLFFKCPCCSSDAKSLRYTADSNYQIFITNAVCSCGYVDFLVETTLPLFNHRISFISDILFQERPQKILPYLLNSHSKAVEYFQTDFFRLERDGNSQSVKSTQKRAAQLAILFLVPGLVTRALSLTGETFSQITHHF